MSGCRAWTVLRPLDESSQTIRAHESCSSPSSSPSSLPASPWASVRAVRRQIGLGRDFLPAMEAVVEGERFVSAKMAGRGFEPTMAIAREIRRHEAGFYEDESSLLDGYTKFVEGALMPGMVS